MTAATSARPTIMAPRNGIKGIRSIITKQVNMSFLPAIYSCTEVIGPLHIVKPTHNFDIQITHSTFLHSFKVLESKFS